MKDTYYCQMSLTRVFTFVFTCFLWSQRPPTGKRTYQETAERIKAIVTDYGQGPLLDYLRGIAQNFNL